MNNFNINKLKLFLSLLSVILILLFISVCAAPGGGGGGGGGGGSDPAPVTKYTLTIQVVGDGTVNPAVGTYTYNIGTVVTLTATPDAGNVFVQWRGDLIGDTIPGQITMNSNKTVTAFFVDEGANKFALNTTITNPAFGSLQTTPAPDPVDNKYYDGTEVTLKAVPVPGYTLKEWTNALTGRINPSIVTMDADKTVNAEFKEVFWTILIHFAIDNNIDYEFEKNYGIITNYLNTLEGIRLADFNNNNDLEILVLMDCYNSNTTFKDGYYRLTGGNFNNDLVVSKSEINSGSLTETEAFMDWAIANYSSNRSYMYSVFNHGSGFDDQNDEGTYSTYGIAFDDSHDDSLSHHELGLATGYLKNLIGKNIELFYPYACLMGGVELAYEVRNNANYLLFSEELFPAEEWSYEALNSILANPAITGDALGQAFCDDAEDYFTNVAFRDFTLSVIDLSEIDDLVDEIDAYAVDAIADINASNNLVLYNSAVDNSLTFTSYNNFYYVDLGEYLTNIDIATAIDVGPVTTALNNCVIYKTYNGFDYQNASGLSIFHNIIGSRYYYNPPLYESILDFGSTNEWTNYIEKFTVLPDTYEPDNTSSTAKTITVNSPGKQRRTCHSLNTGYFDYDIIRVTLQGGTTYKIETYPYLTAGLPNADTWLGIFSSSGNLLDEDDDGSITPYYSLLNFTCPSTGTYYIYVDCWYRAGYYDIDVNTVLGLSKSRDNINKSIEKKRDRTILEKAFK